ncbi:hypothetical protein BH23VER1_BH23VER1_34270 [soil metagenome]
MIAGPRSLVAIPLALCALVGAEAADLKFREVSADAGLASALAGIKGHGAGWGDVNGDGLPDLYVATFHTGDGAKPNQLFLAEAGGGFSLSPDTTTHISTRATGVVLADFDNDGDLDLYVASMPAPEGSKLAEKSGHPLAGCALFRNEGNGTFEDVSAGNGACPESFGGRSAAVLDYDGDGLLDLLVGEDPIPGYNGSETRSSRLFRNEGNLQFRDATAAAGIPAGIPGLGVAAADVNDDTWPDLFIASHQGGNRLFLNNRDGTFREAKASPDTFAWPEAKGDNMVCGIAFGDLNRDGLLDMVIGQHFQNPWVEPVANRLYLNRGIDPHGEPEFEDVSAAAGLVPLPMKSPHIEIQDFDNDGWPDIATTIVKFADGLPHPFIFQGTGMATGSGVPQFHAPALGANPFPTDADRALTRSGDLFDKINREKSILYTAPGPVSDYDRDGLPDLFLASWFAETPSLLLRNETESSHHWLAVSVRGTGGTNAMGVGSRIHLYRAGGLGDPDQRLGSREIAVGSGYASGQEAIAHFGLGDQPRCDIEVILPHEMGRIVRRDVGSDQYITLTQE